MTVPVHDLQGPTIAVPCTIFMGPTVPCTIFMGPKIAVHGHGHVHVYGREKRQMWDSGGMVIRWP